MKKRVLCGFTGMMLLFGAVSVTAVLAMDLEPRQWSHLPLGMNFAGAGYAYTTADIYFDPVMNVEDAKLEMHTAALKYIRTFGLFGTSGRVDVTQAYQDGTWTGLLNGAPTSISRSGWTDTFVRVAANIYGAPPLAGKEFAAYRQKTDTETIVGTGLAVRLPTGEYMPDKLINLGQNQYVFRPQLGVMHTHKKWTTELTGEVSIATVNNEFYNGKTLKQEPLYIIHAHLARTFRPGLWAGVSVGYDYGGESSVNGIRKDNKSQDIAWACSFAYPLNRQVGIKTAYIGTRTQESVGFDSDTFTTGISVAW